MNDSRALDLITLLLRLSFGSLMLLQHGLPKLEKLFWGDPAQFADPLGIGPVPSLALVVFAEFLCSILIMLGLFTRLAVVPLIIAMLVVVFMVNGPNPLADKELGLLYLAAFLAILIGGAGYYSLDRMIKKPL
ncbi:MAG: DoxX family protein [Saprospiraceae bacterium]